MTELERCRSALLKAEEAYDELKNKQYWECSRAISEAKERIENKLSAKYGEEQSRLHEAARAARQAYETAVVADAHANLPYPIGTKMIGWARKNQRYGRNMNPLEPIASGIIEVFSRDSETPENIRYGLPDIGDVVVRVLKKDGTPSVKYDSYRNGKHKWLPEGEKPKDS